MAYLSMSGGKFRVIQDGLPISVDKDTAADALAVAHLRGLAIGSDMWNGDLGRFVPMPAWIQVDRRSL
jgi:hypothetical protein